MPLVTVNVVIRNRLGLHARPAMTFVDMAAGFGSNIFVSRVDQPDEPVDGKSIMQMMMLAATQGTELKITIEGDDAEKAARDLKALVEGGFDEE
ncbi:MAG: HPr family phosphocarrier protein [Phycisphaerales bacterium]|nr:HPr family phosphocarrier protein [Phycisphaerales bacterium]